MRIGIVGHEAAKFTPETEAEARAVVRHLLDHEGADDVLVSGGCHLDGIDIWAEEEADRWVLAGFAFVRWLHSR